MRTSFQSDLEVVGADRASGTGVVGGNKRNRKTTEKRKEEGEIGGWKGRGAPTKTTINPKPHRGHAQC